MKIITNSSPVKILLPSERSVPEEELWIFQMLQGLQQIHISVTFAKKFHKQELIIRKLSLENHISVMLPSTTIVKI